MAEALAVVGLVSAIVQFVGFRGKVAERLDEFKSNPRKMFGVASEMNEPAAAPAVRYIADLHRMELEGRIA